MSSLTLGSLFSGYGGLDLAVKDVLDAVPAWHCETDQAASRVLAHRFPDVPNLGDVTRIRWKRRHRVDILAGGFPCQDLSTAGARRGLGTDTRSGLWVHFARAIDALRPRLVVIENVKGILSAPAHVRALGPIRPGVVPNRATAIEAVFADLAAFGYGPRWICVRASDVGAPHQRERVFIVASPADPRRQRIRQRLDSRHTDGEDREMAGPRTIDLTQPRRGGCPDTGRHRHLGRFGPAADRWASIVGRPAHASTERGPRSGRATLAPQFVEWMMGLESGWVTEVPQLSRTAQLRILGNGVVPQQASLALRALLDDERWMTDE
ncbi:DNA cytosine methyltransferase [Stackebrandtia soli]|uniref:DNA cytosine methyltransferase n=1 Tax=Stackebrandtia soli TaxID=1892856 RepID=UPI0039E98FC7